MFPKEKAPGTFRVFILGESAAAGTPDPAFGFARQLDLLLREQYPSNRFEVINAAMRGIDSHMVRQIAAECAELSPDLFIIYMGNNEMTGLHAPSPGQFRLTGNIHWLRLQQALKRTKLAQLVESILAGKGKSAGPGQNMEFFRRQRIAFDDPKREPVYLNYEANLRDICRFADAAGARAIVSSVAVNLHDFPPLGSLHRRGLSAGQLKQWQQFFSDGVAAESHREFTNALSHYEMAAHLDDHYAELLFRIARCDEALGQLAEARRHYVLARDWDTLQFRTDSRLNELTRSVAANSGPHVRFVDTEQICAGSILADHGIPGGKIFREHVHLTFDGDYQVATSLLPEVATALKLAPSAQPPLSRDECARRLAYTPLNEGYMKAAIARLTANPPFLDQIEHDARQAAADAEVQQKMGQVSREEIENAIATYRQAIQARPDDWMMHFNLANLLSQVNQPKEAAVEYAGLAKRLPRQRIIQVGYGNALLQAGQRYEASQQFAAALQVDPDYPPARQGLKAAQGK